jgi:hypothetical protein
MRLVIAIVVGATPAVVFLLIAFRPIEPLRIARETTFMTAPLRADGSVDYLAATNERYRAGATAENNASLLLWHALGPGPCDPLVRDEFFSALGIPVPPEEGDYFVPLEAFVQEQLADSPADISERLIEAEEQLDVAVKRPWKAEEFPLLAEWLDANEKPLALVVDATRRTRRYDPLVATEESNPYASADLAMATACRSLAKTLVARAMLRSSAGQTDQAWRDLIVALRLSRLVTQGPTVFEGLTGIAIDRLSCPAQRVFLQHSELNAEQIARMRADLEALSPAGDMVQKLDVSDRFLCLDQLSSAARGVSQGETDAPDMPDLSGKPVDWNIVFSRVNAEWDRQIAAGRLPSRSARKAALAKLEAELIARDPRTFRGIVRSFFSRRARSTGIADIYLGLMTPLISAVYDAADTGALELDMTKLAFALAAYRADNGAYPEQLSNLVPKYLARVPDDAFSEKPIHYALEDGGYVLDSLGRDQRDDPLTDAPDADGDDVIVRMPGPSSAPLRP